LSGQLSVGGAGRAAPPKGVLAPRRGEGGRVLERSGVGQTAPMGHVDAVRMLVRAAWRRYWRSSLFLAVSAGLAAAVAGASFQAASRAAIGIPVGMFITQRVWRAVTAGIDLPARAATAWATVVITPLAAVAVTTLVAQAASTRALEVGAGRELTVE